MFTKRLARFALPSLLLLLGGCSLLAPAAVSGKAPEEISKTDLRIARVLAKEGLEKLHQARYDDASRIFNAGLKFSPDNAQLHFLNGMAYHLLYLRGDESKRELAATGYELALSYDPAHYFAAVQLGRLEFGAKRYDEAVEAFRHAIDIEPQKGEGHYGLAASAYYAHDLTSARAAIELAEPLLPDNEEVTRAAAMIYAALGDPDKARNAAARYAVFEQNSGARKRLDTRIDQWRSWHASRPSTLEGRNSAIELAQIYPSPSDDDSSPILPISPVSPALPSTSAVEATSPKGAAPRSWFDCGSGSSYTAPSIGSGYSSTGGDESTQLPSLPSPCQGAGNPRMLVLDIAFIRTENNASTSHGINLLDGLSYVFNQSRTITNTFTRSTGSADSRNITITDTRTRGLPSDGIAYSLNIANSTDSRTEMLANPSLVALDRMPSTFFSGTNVTLGISGQNGSASSVTDRPIGVSLSVTPTFIDGETVLLAVKASRSFVETVDEAVVFGHTLQTSRNAVSANVVLKMGQTLILSGLSEQEMQRNSDGVPVLKDIPVLQYLFSSTMTQNFTRSVLVLITPRAPAYDREVMEKTIQHIDTLDKGKRFFRPLIEKTMKASPDSAPGNLENTYKHIFGNKLFLQFRSGDLVMQHWSEPPRLESLFRDVLELLDF